MKRVVVLTGGSTPERQVALAGAGQVVAALRQTGFEVTVVDTCRGPLDAAGEAVLSAGVAASPPSPEELAALAGEESLPEIVSLPAVRQCDLVFPVLHGRQGEGGQLQALLELAGVCFAGSGALGSMLAMDKEVAKRLMRVAGVQTPPGHLWPVHRRAVTALGYPVVVKPSRVGSTVGLSVVPSFADLAPAVELARSFDDEVLVERFIAGRELTVGVLGEEPLVVGEIVTGEGVFDYERKYQPGAVLEVFPAEIDAETAAEVQRLGRRVHRALKLRDFSRVDFRLDAGGELFCLEANTLPGMTATSLLPQSAAAAGIPFHELVRRICELALTRGAE